MEVNNLQKINELLKPYIDYTSVLPGGDCVLDRMYKLMDIYGNPQNNYKIIHIAGTSGKTSTAYYISSFLTQANQDTGLIVSPHVYDIRERIQINNRQLDQLEFYILLQEFISLAKLNNIAATYFEIMYAFGFWAMYLKKVKYAVVETGVGGLIDATNILTNKDKVCVITDIGLDHQKILGNDIREIALHKAGIIHNKNLAIVVGQDNAVLDVIRKWAISKKSKMIVVDTEEDEENLLVSSLPSFQRRNWLMAKSVFRALQKRDDLISLGPVDIKATQLTYIPGRMEIKKISDKTVILDGAHNEQKIKALITSIEEIYPNKKVSIVVALKKTKDVENISKTLALIADKVIATTFYSTKYLKSESIDPRILADNFKSLNIKEVHVISDHEKAFKAALRQSSLLVVTGSFYLISQLRDEGLI